MREGRKQEDAKKASSSVFLKSQGDSPSLITLQAGAMQEGKVKKFQASGKMSVDDTEEMDQMHALQEASSLEIVILKFKNKTLSYIRG